MECEFSAGEKSTEEEKCVLISSKKKFKILQNCIGGCNTLDLMAS